MAKYALRLTALGYLLFLLVLPVFMIFRETFKNGIGPVLDALSTHSFLHALQITAQVAILATIANTIFGVGMALLLTRHEFRGKRLLNALIDLPIAVSPIVVGLALILVYGRFAPIGGWFDRNGIQIIFSLPGMVMATAFIALPLVVRAIVPVLEEIGMEQEQAAWTLGARPVQAFRRVTLPAIRWALAYGVVLALARSLGEFGAVAVVSGRLVDQTQTLTLFVSEKFENFDQQAAYAASFVLALVAILSMLVITFLRPKEDAR